MKNNTNKSYEYISNSMYNALKNIHINVHMQRKPVNIK